MRAILALVILLAAGGCSNSDWQALAINPDAFFGEDSDASSAPAQPLDLSNTTCRDVAFDRTADVADQGFDESVRRAVFAGTYADCVAWAARSSTLMAQ
jgi:hypothetical protein